MDESDRPVSVEERRLRMDEERLRLDRSFARKWLPAVATVTVAFVAGVFGYVQHLNTTAVSEREWNFRVIEWYFHNQELFDLSRHPDQAERNLRVLAAVAPEEVVLGIYEAERDRIPAPGAEGEGGDGQRLESLAAAAEVQSAIERARGPGPRVESRMRPSEVVVYIQYAEGSRATALRAQEALRSLGYRAPGTEPVPNVPSGLQVRYYRPEQKELAESLAVELGGILGLEATASNAVRLRTERELPSGILELWLPREGTP